MSDLLFGLLYSIIMGTPFVLTIWNLVAFIWYLIRKRELKYSKTIEVFAICLSIIYLSIYISMMNITFANWDVVLYNDQIHSFISPDAFPSIAVISLIAFSGYLLIRFISAGKQSPIVSAVGIAAIYLGIGICILFCIQTSNVFFLVLTSVNYIIILVRAIVILVVEKNALFQDGTCHTKYIRLSKILNKATNLPWIALILAIPLLGIIVLVLSLFGQAPNSIISAWTQTADWTMSQKEAPQNVFHDEHYLCTVAAGGHKKIVKPIRTGVRHGHRVIVNRQLCVANAFEQVLEEKVPKFHKLVRNVYDCTGYPISKHIKSKFVADLIYFVMKPIEWGFIIVLYLVDVNPENRISVQYPHSVIKWR